MSTKNKGARNWKVIEATATTTTASASWDVDEIFLLSNDGAVDISFTYDNGTQFTMKKGETYQNVPLKVSTLHYETSSGTAAFRAHGLKR